MDGRFQSGLVYICFWQGMAQLLLCFCVGQSRWMTAISTTQPKFRVRDIDIGMSEANSECFLVAYTYETAKRAAELTHEGHLGWYRQFSCFDQHWSFDWSFHRALDN
jgi:hypothetical protein